jgi:organic hydroperoxide reductase OsmC/OhrA
LKFVAGKEKKSSLVENAKVHATVNIGTPNEAPGFALSVKLEVENVSDESLVQAAHEVIRSYSFDCGYSFYLKGLSIQSRIGSWN